MPRSPSRALIKKAFGKTVRSLRLKAGLAQEALALESATLWCNVAIAGKSRRRAGQDTQRQRLMEEFALLDREVENYKPRIQRWEKLRQLILDWHQELEPDEELTVPALSCDILITSRDQVRSVTLAGKQKLFRLWGPKGFIARSTMLLKSLPDPKDEDGLYTQQALTGPRHLHVMHRVPAAASSAA